MSLSLPTANPLHTLRLEEAVALASGLQAAGRPGDALAILGPLQAARPGDPGMNAMLGTALAQLGRLDEAIAFLAQAARLDAGNPDTLHNLATALQQAGRRDEAVDAWNQLGTLHYAARRYAAAQTAYESALALAPDHFGANTNLAATRQAQGDHAAAIARLTAILAGSPEEAEALNSLGNVQMEAGDLDSAITSYRRAIALRRDNVEAYSNLGLALSRRHPDGAAEPDDSTDELREQAAAALLNLGNARQGQDPALDARGCFERALELKPDFAAAHWNHALSLLLHGDMERGWAEYEWRWRWQGFAEESRPFTQPVWRGEPPERLGGVLLVTAEQGFGDTLQFVRYLPLLAERGYDVVFEAQAPLFTLLWYSLGRRGVRVIPRTESPARVHEDLRFAAHVPLLGLPERFGTRLDSIPGDTPYLHAEPGRWALWEDRLSAAAGGRVRVGLVWQGRREHARDFERSIPPDLLAPLLAVPGVQFFSFHRTQPRQPVEMPPGVVPLDGLLHDFAEAAAAMANMDLVITVDTAAAHLAGAMGLPVWVMLARSPDWRWLLDRADSPWYPSVTLFRQRRSREWEPVLAEVAAALAAFVAEIGQ